MKGRAILVFFFAFFLMLSLGNIIRAEEEEPFVGIILTKEVSTSTSYAINIKCDGGGDKVKKILFKIPKNGNMSWINKFSFSDFSFAKYSMNYDDFEKMFPAGKYEIIYYPKKFGKRIVNITHNFPETPEIIYPKDGEEDIPLNPKITWEPLNGINYIRLSIEGDDDDDPIRTELELQTKDTSFTVPNGWLKPDTKYEIELETGIVNQDERYRLHTVRRKTFTTVAE